MSLSLVAGVQIDAGFKPVFAGGSSGHFDAVQPDGKLLVNGLAARYNPDGTRDTGFSAPTTLGNIRQVLVAQDGKIVVWSTAPAGDTLSLLNTDGSLNAVLGTAISPMSLDAIAVQADGKVIVSGSVTINGSQHGTLVRLNRDGTRDTTFDAGAGPDAQVESLSIQADGKVVAAGYFTTFDNTAHGQLVRLNVDGTVDPTFTFAPTVASSVTTAAVLPGGKIIAAVRQTIMHGLYQAIRLNADGSQDAVLGAFDGGSGAIYALTPLADGSVLFGGGFSTFADTPVCNLGRLDSSGALDPSFAAGGIDADVKAVAVDGSGRIYVNLSANTMLRLSATGQPDPAFVVGAAQSGTVFAAAGQADGHIVAVGDFMSVDGMVRTGVCRFQADGAVDPSFSPGAPLSWNNDPGIGVPNSAAVAVQPDGSVIVGGTFTIGGAAPRAGLARFRSDGSIDTAFTATLNAGGAVSSLLTLSDGRVVIGGNFSSVNGQARGNIAAFLADGSLDPVFGATITTNGAVTKLAARSSGGLFIAGSFTTVGGSRRNQLAALANDGTLDGGFAPATLTSTDTITALTGTNDGGVVIAIPKARSSTGYDRAQLVRLDATGAVAASFTFPFDINATFTALTSDAQGGIIAGYSVLEGIGFGASKAYYYLHRFTATGAFDSDFDIGNGLSGNTNALFVAADGTLIVGGSFTTIDDLSVSPLVRFTPAQTAPTRLVNISSRAGTDVGASVLTAGFVIAGSQPKTVLIRAVGPTLSTQGITGPLPDPFLSIYRLGATTPFATNSQWTANQVAHSGVLDQGFNVAVTGQRLGAFALQNNVEAAVVVTLDPGLYTALVSGESGTAASGVSLVEVYDANRPTGDRRLVNISSRARVNAGEQVLIGGFVIAGSTPQKVLIRAVGPTLSTMGVDGALADPKFDLYSMASGKINENDNWGGTTELSAAFAATGAFALPTNSKDAALLTTLQPGAYSVIVSGVGGTSGVALVEVYLVP